MASVNLSPLFNGQTLFGPTALPLTGGQIFTYQAGSTTPLTTYTTSSGNIAQTNPVVLGTDGKLVQELWLQSGYSYKFVVEDSANNLIATYDNIAGIITQLPTVAPVVPTGCILIWSGSTGSIPSGFVICDGSNGTPDLRNSFVLGAGNSYTVGQVGGSTDSSLPIHTHTATVTDPTHVHSYNIQGAGGPGGDANIYYTTGGSFYTAINTTSAATGISVANSNTGTSPSNLNMPPYYALAYIMKT